MKANKLFAMALAALALVACKKTGDVTALELSQTSATIAVGETLTLTANVTVDSWTSNKPEVATVTDGVVLGVAEGTAIISATAGSDTKTCVVKVEADNGGNSGSAEIKGSQVWPIIMDGVTYEANQSKVVATFQPNDLDQFLYVWDNTYAGGDAPGMNAMGNAEGYTSLVVGTVGWSGAGFFLSEGGDGMNKCRALRDAIVANPDQYFLHFAIKSTDQGSHTFYFMNTDATKFVLGTVFDGGTAIENFTRDGKWYHYDIPMAQYANALATADLSTGANVFVMLSGGTPGVVLNLDAVYFYKK
ncbi:MAG: Ig-like domain-containing protein [Paludibacteraceae bacterium]